MSFGLRARFARAIHSLYVYVDTYNRQPRTAKTKTVHTDCIMQSLDVCHPVSANVIIRRWRTIKTVQKDYPIFQT